jgi:molybdopterin synthase sulfur carrier subunit
LSTPLPAPDSLPAVRVRLFASLRETAGWSEREVALPEGFARTPCTPRRLWEGLASPVHALPSSLPPGLRVAINQRFATPDTPLQPGDELAFLPPITGG